MTIGNVYKLKSNTDNDNIIEYEELTAGTVVPSVLDATNAPVYSCNNVLKEIAYTVQLTSVDAPDKDVSKVAYLKIESISADFVV